MAQRYQQYVCHSPPSLSVRPWTPDSEGDGGGAAGAAAAGTAAAAAAVAPFTAAADGRSAFCSVPNMLRVLLSAGQYIL